jgi:hypothetical protein
MRVNSAFVIRLLGVWEAIRATTRSHMSDFDEC